MSLVLGNSPEALHFDLFSSHVVMYVTGHNEEGRGMELSELTYFNHRLYAGDDRTGIVYELTQPANQAIGK